MEPVVLSLPAPSCAARPQQPRHPHTPHAAAAAAASSDKTVSIWDPRSGLSTCTFYGHTNSCNSVVFSASASSLASADADGVVKLWDVRMVAEVFSVAAGEYPANRAAFDASGLVSDVRVCCVLASRAGSGAGLSIHCGGARTTPHVTAAPSRTHNHHNHASGAGGGERRRRRALLQHGGRRRAHLRDAGWWHWRRRRP